MMKLRLDLLEHLTDEDILQEAAANQHRYKPEPTFSRTGVGYLAPRSAEEALRDGERSEALPQKLKQRLLNEGKNGAHPS
jgi:hypothetical protein